MRIMFVCLGNICRSTMAEAVFNHLTDSKYYVRSGGTLAEKNHGIHIGTIKELKKHNINANDYVYGEKGYQIVKEDYDKYDVFYCMDSSNVKNLKKIFNNDSENKVRLLLDRDILDPWYTGNFSKTYDDILEGINKILQFK